VEDMWLAAVMPAAGVTASFVSWYWHQTHEKPEPAFIKAKMLEAGVISSSGIKMIHIPDEISGKSDFHASTSNPGLHPDFQGVYHHHAHPGPVGHQSAPGSGETRGLKISDLTE
ncbi:hypothetical protein H0H93_011440, partial [Arthromyces matolae]